jgi:hypothetical protein
MDNNDQLNEHPSPGCDDNFPNADARLSLLLDAIARPRDWTRFLTEEERQEIEHQRQRRSPFFPRGIPGDARSIIFERIRRGIFRSMPNAAFDEHDFPS